MAKIRPKTAEQLAKMRIDGADLLVATWLWRKVVAPRGAHWDQCPIDVTLSEVSFGVGVGGGCSTCSYTYDEATLTVFCGCGARSKAYEIDMEMHGGQGAILTELAALAAELELPGQVASAAEEEVLESIEGLAERRDEINDQIADDRARY